MWPVLPNPRHSPRARRALRRTIRLTRIDDAVALAFAGAEMVPDGISAYFGDHRGRLLMSMCFDLEHSEQLASWPLGLPHDAYRTALLVSNEPVELVPSEDRIGRWLATRANFADDGVELVDWMVVDRERLESLSIRTGVGRWGGDSGRSPDVRHAA